MLASLTTHSGSMWRPGWNRVLARQAAAAFVVLLVVFATIGLLSPGRVSSAWQSTYTWGASRLPSGGPDTGSDHNSQALPSSPSDLTALIAALFAPLKLSATTPEWTDRDGTVFALPAQPTWRKPLGKRLCIIDIDTRPLDGEHEILSNGSYNWQDTKVTSAGMMGHYLYAQIHGYDYKFVRTHNFEDRSSFWTKIAALSDTLRDYDFVISIDADAQFNHPEIPFEWLLNRWNVTHQTALTMTVDPDLEFNRDPRNRPYNNGGFVVAHNIPRTHEMLQAWAACPDEPTEFYAGCAKWKEPWPAEQAAFGDYIRYMYDQPNDLNEIPCDEANGFPDSQTACTGRFVRHMWTAKERTKDVIANGVMQALLGQLHDQFLASDSIIERKTNEFMRAGE